MCINCSPFLLNYMLFCLESYPEVLWIRNKEQIIPLSILSMQKVTALFIRAGNSRQEGP